MDKGDVMSLVTAIRSFFTPTKHYRNAYASIHKKLLRDGSVQIQSYDHSGNLLKTIIRENFDVLKCNRKYGNTLSVGHVTTVKDYVAGTETTINKLEKKFERPVYSALEPDKMIVDAGGKVNYFHKFKMRDGKYVESFNMRTDKNSSAGVKILYDESGKAVSATKINIQKG